MNGYFLSASVTSIRQCGQSNVRRSILPVRRRRKRGSLAFGKGVVLRQCPISKRRQYLHSIKTFTFGAFSIGASTIGTFIVSLSHWGICGFSLCAQAEFAAEYIKKGRLIAVDGRIANRRWTDKTTGNDRESFYLIANK